MTKASYADIQWISGEQMPRSLGQVNVQMAEGVGFEPTREREPPADFQDRCLKPLGHPSNALIHRDFVIEAGAVKRSLLPKLLPNAVILRFRRPS